MKKIPLPIGTLHFVGIGGIGMSGIAEVMHNLGYIVQGSDAKASANTQRLEKMGIKVFIGHDADHVKNAEVLIRSSAVKQDNLEVVAARQKMIPIIERAEMLAEIMRLKSAIAIAGTHGKTTTTSLVAHIIDTANMDPTVINGGIINAYGTNAKLGQGDWMVVEADESDGTFVKLRSIIAVVTNIDAEHLDHFGSFENLQKSFEDFVHNIPFYGYGVLCIDHPNVQRLIPKVSEKKIVTYGFNPQADFKAEIVTHHPEGVEFNVTISERYARDEIEIKNIKLSMLGKHNVSNALAGIAVAYQMGVDSKTIKKALQNFEGVKRRFTKTGEVNGVHIYDDYGHHPVEISAVLEAARASCKGKLIAVFQPHRYSRVRDLFNDFCTCFNNADTVIVSDIYPAGESPLEGISQKSLIKGLRQSGHKNVIALESAETLASQLAEELEEGAYVVCLGAGDVTTWANNLPQELETLLPARPKVVGQDS